VRQSRPHIGIYLTRMQRRTNTTRPHSSSGTHWIFEPKKLQGRYKSWLIAVSSLEKNREINSHLSSCVFPPSINFWATCLGIDPLVFPLAARRFHCRSYMVYRKAMAIYKYRYPALWGPGSNPVFIYPSPCLLAGPTSIQFLLAE